MKYDQITEAKKNREDKLEVVKLPYKLGDLSPVLSKNNVDYHYNDFNYGGAKLHNLFWSQLRKPTPSNKPSGAVKELIEKNHKTFDAFKKEMLRMAMSIQGSGWVYMARNGSIKKTPNQSYKTDILMPIDMWEHSFMDYIPAKDAKKKYVESMMRIIDWEQINQRLS